MCPTQLSVPCRTFARHVSLSIRQVAQTQRAVTRKYADGRVSSSRATALSSLSSSCAHPGQLAARLCQAQALIGLRRRLSTVSLRLNVGIASPKRYLHAEKGMDSRTHGSGEGLKRKAGTRSVSGLRMIHGMNRHTMESRAQSKAPDILPVQLQRWQQARISLTPTGHKQANTVPRRMAYYVRTAVR